MTLSGKPRVQNLTFTSLDRSVNNFAGSHSKGRNLKEKLIYSPPLFQVPYLYPKWFEFCQNPSGHSRKIWPERTYVWWKQLFLKLGVILAYKYLRIYYIYYIIYISFKWNSAANLTLDLLSLKKSLITVVCMVKEFFVDRHTDIYTHRHIHTSKLISFQLSYLDQDACKPSTAYWEYVNMDPD